jgi:hypothetical protein
MQQKKVIMENEKLHNLATRAEQYRQELKEAIGV